jgi:spermidine synthase
MRVIKIAVFISGFAAVIAQTLIIREGLSLFGGNELVSGLLLCFWLAWVGIGSIVFTRLQLRIRPVLWYSLLLFLLSVFGVFSITIIRLAPYIFSLPFGEIISLDKIIFIALISLAPTCIIFGMLFPAASKLLKPEKVYLLEGIGSFFGGIIISFVLIQFLSSYGILLIMLCTLIACAFSLINRKLIFVSLCMLPLFFKIGDIELILRKIQMGGQVLIGLRESRYGVIAVTQSGTQVNFYTNGVYDFSYPDLYSSEEAVHYPLLVHGSPRSVLLVGGGMGNCITQIFKHPDITEVTYCELDPLLFAVGEKYIGERVHEYKNLTIIFGDARFFIKHTRKKYDVIIINLPDPVNAQLNRFYTVEFFAETKKTLNPDGMLSVRITSPPDIISPNFGQLLNSIYKSLHASFKNILILPAAKTTYIATEQEIHLEDIVDILKMHMRERKLDLVYVNDYFFDYNFTWEKLDYVSWRVKESKGILNTDVKPVCYYFTNTLWGGMPDSLKKGFMTLFSLHPVWFLLPLIFILLFFRRRSMVYVSVLAIGASEISTEVILIILFQIVYGYLYGWIGAIIACYMLGLAAGTLFYLKSSLMRGNSMLKLSYLEIVMGIYCGVIILLAVAQLPGTNFIIPVLIFTGGFLGGLHFPMSVAILKREKAGIVYGVDLFGSSVGALITTVIFIPILGIVFTLVIFILLNLLVGIGLRTVSV